MELSYDAETFSDPADHASSIEIQARQRAIEAARSTSAVARTGTCSWCETAVPPAALYCDQFCREDHQKALWAAQQKPGKLA